ncbi:LacI family DNA-binding transcriptional regulator [Microlunatus panaciterrae]|uniref:LacI family transcriptional regulator n=1 Tax=Microlunatus panaciterrae TaxID=400768 RepID=A0ABS2RJL9_9ACTN|nr:LacI family DNA-binding transcriptional regulator [Microlunatus panaciterrae]MBM7798762.1 LacI family transcriptional regulator [Microlunatus panaciterrae]
MPRLGGPTPVTLHDVAREAGVSLATASRAINGSDRKVKEEYRSRVLAAAAKLHYKPNRAAQAVARGSTLTVGLLVGDISDPYFSTIAAGVVNGAEQAGLIVTMAATERDTTRELDLVRAMTGQRPKVLIIAGSRFTDDPHREELVAELTDFEATGGRVVMISQAEMPFDTVLLDNRDGARRLAEELVALGYRRFAILTSQPTLLTSRDRLDGFLAGLAAHGLTVAPERIVETEFTRDGGYTAASRLAAEGLDDVELIFAVNDVMAVGALSALRESGLVPGTGIAVAGYDDIPTVRDVTPALSTVHIPLYDVGLRAIELATSPRDSAEPVHSTVQSTVVLRGSTPVRTLAPQPG